MLRDFVTPVSVRVALEVAAGTLVQGGIVRGLPVMAGAVDHLARFFP
jgi:hypothetical protein